MSFRHIFVFSTPITRSRPWIDPCGMGDAIADHAVNQLLTLDENTETILTAERVGDVTTRLIGIMEVNYINEWIVYYHFITCVYLLVIFTKHIQDYT